VEWTQSGAEGAARFVQRVWSFVDALPEKGPFPAPGSDDASTALRKASHKAVAGIDKAIEEFRFNSAIATVHEWVNTLKKAESDPATVGARAEGADMLARCLVPFMPHLAEACWERLSNPGLVSQAGWPEVDGSLVVDDTVTLAVQVNGKRRAEIVVAKDMASDAVEAAAKALPEVATFIEGKSVKKTIVVPGRIVNIVVA